MLNRSVIEALSDDRADKRVRGAYAAAMKLYHPDQNGGSRAGEEALVYAAKAYKMLETSELRQSYAGISDSVKLAILYASLTPKNKQHRDHSAASKDDALKQTELDFFAAWEEECRQSDQVVPKAHIDDIPRTPSGRPVFGF